MARNVFRLCNPNVWPPIIDWDGKKIIGQFSPLFDSLFELMLRGSNLTLQIRSQNDGLGELIDREKGLYNGCLGRLQTNQSDFIPQLTTYPFDGENLTQGLIFVDSAIEFVTAYKQGTLRTLHLEWTLAAFAWQTWAVCFLILLTIYTLMLVRYRVNSRLKREICNLQGVRVRYRQRNHYFFYQAATHLTRFNSIEDGRSIFIRLIIFSASFFASFVLNTFMCNLKTDLVSIIPPKVHTRYSDLIDQNVATIFISGLGHFLPFKYAEPGSKEQRLWNLSVNKYSEKVIVDAAGSERKTKENILRILRKDAVLVIESAIMPMYLSFACEVACSLFTLKSLFGDKIGSDTYLRLPVGYRDPMVKPALKGLVFNEQSTGPGYNRVRKNMKNFLAAGLTSQTIIDGTQLAKEMVPFRKDDSVDEHKLERCKDGAVYTPEIQWRPITLHHIKSLCCHTFGAFIFYFILCLGEMIVFRWKMKGRKKRSRQIWSHRVY